MAARTKALAVADTRLERIDELGRRARQRAEGVHAEPARPEAQRVVFAQPPSALAQHLGRRIARALGRVVDCRLGRARGRGGTLNEADGALFECLAPPPDDGIATRRWQRVRRAAAPR